MRTVMGLAGAALIALVVAVLTGSTLAAVLVVILALAGIVLLVRDWREERTVAPDPVSEATGPEQPEAGRPTANELSPDVAGSDQF